MTKVCSQCGSHNCSDNIIYVQSVITDNDGSVLKIGHVARKQRIGTCKICFRHVCSEEVRDSNHY